MFFTSNSSTFDRAPAGEGAISVAKCQCLGEYDLQIRSQMGVFRSQMEKNLKWLLRMSAGALLDVQFSSQNAINVKIQLLMPD
jgi:hypothetical protein